MICEIALKYHKIWIIRNDKNDYRNSQHFVFVCLLVVELFFYNHLMITFRAVHHIVFFRFIWNWFIDQLSRCFFFVTEFCTFHQYIFFSMFCHFFCPWMNYMYKYTALWLYIYIELDLRLKESIKWVRYLNLLSLFLRTLVLGLRELSLFFLIPRSACTLSMVFLEVLASNN